MSYNDAMVASLESSYLNPPDIFMTDEEQDEYERHQEFEDIIWQGIINIQRACENLECKNCRWLENDECAIKQKEWDV